MTDSSSGIDRQSERFLDVLMHQDQVRSHRVPGVRTVLVVLSSRGVVFDLESLRQKVLLAYPEAAVFFRTTSGKAVGVAAPSRVDLLIDLTGPGQRQSFCYPRKLRSMARVAVGRNAGIFRKRIYDRVFDEKVGTGMPAEFMERERFVQRSVLEKAGIPLAQEGDTHPDRGKTIALELPLLKHI